MSPIRENSKTPPMSGGKSELFFITIGLLDFEAWYHRPLITHKEIEKMKWLHFLSRRPHCFISPTNSVIRLPIRRLATVNLFAPQKSHLKGESYLNQSDIETSSETGAMQWRYALRGFCLTRQNGTISSYVRIWWATIILSIKSWAHPQ